MPLSNAQYDRLMREYDRRQLQDRAEQEARIHYAMAEIPGLATLEESFSDLSVERSRALLAGQSETAARLARQLASIKEEKAVLLASAGLPADYLELHYQCPACRDTGYSEGRKCHCLKQRIVDLLFEQYSIREQLETENFSTFRFDYFDRETVDPSTGLSSYENMQRIYQECRDFADHFSPGKENLLFKGPAGVGKTFLSNCIAEALIRQGFSVVYLPAGRLFELLANAAFRREGEADSGFSAYVLDSDLLIIDDLGAEMNNSFVNSQLFFCLNERKLRKKSTLISTNLTLDEMQGIYTERVTSRLVESYRIYTFYNSDIRIRKRLQSS